MQKGPEYGMIESIVGLFGFYETPMGERAVYQKILLYVPGDFPEKGESTTTRKTGF